MPRYNVEIDGKWVCYSSVVDDFITPLMKKEEYEEWRKIEYGKEYEPVEQCNRKTLAECLRSMSIYHCDRLICDSLRRLGIFVSPEERDENE